MEKYKVNKVSIGMRTYRPSGFSYLFAELDRLGFFELQQRSRYSLNSNKSHNRS
jgi:hypothetical protein